MSNPSIRIEGAIFSPDILERLEDAPGQRPADFNLDTGTKVKDEIARAWADAQDYWRIFQRKLDSLKPDSPATTETRQQWIVPLLGLLGYQLEYQAKGVELNGKNYTISHRATNRGNTPVHVVGYREAAGLDRKPERTYIGAPRMSAHGLVQEYLNLHDELFGLVTNGRLLRMLRDSSRLIKLTYLEFDLDRIFNDGLFADFAILYRLLHVTRLPISNEVAAESLVERYHQDSLDSGARIRDGLSKAVEQAIRDFANGFLSHRDNEVLRQAIRDGDLTPDTYYEHLLRLIYRLLFLLVIEERSLIFPASASRQQRDIFRNYYSVERLRLLSEKRHLADKRFHDHWLGLLATFKLFEAHGPGEKLGIAPLAGDLFNPAAIGPLAQCRLGNDVLLGSLRSLGLYQHPDNGQTMRVNYAALNVEEFGSVYEGLLEFQPVFSNAGERVEFDFALGDQRAATGSHYTPDDLVQPLIKHSLDYLIADALKKPDPAKALLDLRVADIACGSGHILLAAARRIATELAIVRTGEEQPSPTAFRAAIREVIRECIYGVDLNPLAVELCKVALWLEAHTPGEPLNFLDHHIKCGNAIVGFARREEAERGVPDEAFKTLPDDDKETAALLRKRNKKERADHAAGQLPLSASLQKQLDGILRGWNELNRLPEHTPDEIDAKKARYLAFTQSKDSWLLHQIASIPIAQFYIQKRAENLQKFVTDAAYRRYWRGEVSPPGQATAEAWAMAERKRFFHWFLEFPEIMERGGFDCILGNPPYLGNRAISGKYGDAFLGYVKWAFSPAAAVDLVTYFLRRIFDLLKVGGSMALISTNTIAQGAAREGGLDVIVNSGGAINFAIRAKQWTGRAAVSVSLIAIQNRDWKGECTLDGKNVAHITSYLDTAISLGDPITLSENADKSFQGSIVLGLGFVLTSESASSLISRDESSTDVIFPYLNGEDLNSHPEQRASRFVINFFDWDEDRCRINYPELYSIVEERVKPERTRTDESGKFVLRKPLPQKWWVYADKRPKLYESIRNFDKVMVGARVSKYVSFVFVPSRQVFMDKLVVIADQRYSMFAAVQSDIHSAWAWRYSSTMRNFGINYAPSDCFVTFPFPCFTTECTCWRLEKIGLSYHEHRGAVMKSLWLGLTDIYNLFHTRDLTPAEVARVSKKPLREAEAGYQGILELRRLHRELDLAVRDAYGWTDLDLGHDFVEVETLPENDRVRYTISPAARKEVLKRLLAENHRRAAAEATKLTLEAPAKKARGRKQKIEQTNGELFDTGIAVQPPQMVPAQLRLSDLRSLDDDELERPASDQANEEAAVLAAVLKAIAGPTPARDIRLAVLLAMQPRLLLPWLTNDESVQLRRVVGRDSDPLPAGVKAFQTHANRIWGKAINDMRARGRLIENLATGTWAPGEGLDKIITDGWCAGRVSIVLEIMARRGADETMEHLSNELEDWFNDRAA
ncbi:Eco57I restriction-modification methylase domain-containing protein [Rhodocyclus gracilis]|uniref:Eco57I restriction-modification methylase domain-containing protein n=1 Tax=Rhodocyclus gracilis TaxID=2929842 RepID=UPI00188EA894|nr:DNA methyltransferase [Rhodocyclus gracilis]